MSQVAKDAAKKWSTTLCLPNSTFPPRPTAADQVKYLQRCTDDLYCWQRHKRTARNTFVLHDGPPYANGNLHIGHALNKILKDIICRTELREGRQVKYVPGWDCHGLPIELKALDHHGWKKGEDVDPLGIRTAGRQFAQGVVQEQMKGFKSWSVMGDWKGHWKTMDKDFELGQLSVFKALASRELIYRAHKPVYWSPSSRSALAEAELEYNEEHISTAALIKLPVVIAPSIGDLGSQHDSISALIWTTTPWTLPANQAIAVHNDLEYTVARSRNHGLLLLGTSRIPFVEGLMQEKLEQVVNMEGKDFAGCRYKFFEIFDSKAATKAIVHASFVSADAGTGLVHCAPGHGFDDYEALQPYIEQGGVFVKAPVDNEGCFTEDAAPSQPSLLEGLNVLAEGNKKVLSVLEQGRGNHLVAKHTYKHKYPYDWRTKEPIVIRATPQWFANVSKVRDESLQTLEDVTFYPSTGKSRLTSFVTNRSEWCISRQRAWGVPIPALYELDTGKPILTDDSISHIINVIRERGTDAWWSDTPEDPAWLPDYLKIQGKSVNVKRGTDTMDVWFDSGTSWTQLSSPQENYKGRPADVCVEGTDQHRGWFQSSLLTNVAYQKSLNANATPHAPFRALITHGFTLDAQGKKMSKSTGNVISPDEIIDGLPEIPAKDSPMRATPKAKGKNKDKGSLGPDSLRLWVASSDFTKDVTVSPTIVKTVHAALHKYRVTFKLLLGALQDFEPSQAVRYEDLSLMNKIALSQLYTIASTIKDNFADYEFYKAVSNLNRYIATDFSGLYMESIKDTLYCDGVNWPSRRGVQTVLYHILSELQAILAPLTPLLVEESWAHSPALIKQHATPPHERIWHAPPSEWDNSEIRQDLPYLLLINTAVKAAQEAARSAKKMGSSLECDVILRFDSDFDRHEMAESIAKQYAQTLPEMLVVSNVENSHMTGSGTQTGLKDLAGQVGWRYMEDIKSPNNGECLGTAIVQAPGGGRCVRCWRYVVREAHNGTDELCDRCERAVGENKTVNGAWNRGAL